MKTMTKTLTINHADYSNRPSFARVVDAAFAGVAVLPNAAVMSACLRSGGRRWSPVVIDVLCDSDARTAYLVMYIVAVADVLFGRQ
jgi:hypothetical protein